MSFLKKIFFYLDAKKVPSIEEFERSVNQSNALEKLKEFNNDRNTIKLAMYENLSSHQYEWLLASFGLASNVISGDDILDMAQYLNMSEVFNQTAPHLYGYGSDNTHGLLIRLIERCHPKKRPKLLTILEEKGHMQEVARKGLGMPVTYFYFEVVTESYSPEESMPILKRSPSFRIAKENSKNFSSSVINKYPEYKELL